MPRKRSDEPAVRVPVSLTPRNLRALDEAAITIRENSRRFVARSHVINRLIEAADLAALVAEMSAELPDDTDELEIVT